MTEATGILQKVLAEITPSAPERKEFETKVKSGIEKIIKLSECLDKMPLTLFSLK